MNSVNEYIRQLKRRLRCSGEDRKRLLAGLEAELRDAFPDPSSPETITRQFGAPGDAALELEAALPEGAVDNFCQRQRRLKLVAALCAAAAVGMLLFVIWFLANMPVFETVIITPGAR